AVGAAQGLKIRGQEAIAVCFFGDGAINRGPFMEALNWAVVYHLPVLFVCEDNRISATTESRAMTAGPGASARATALGLPAVQVDGTDVQAVSEAAAELVREIRAGSGPRLLHALTDRHKGHVSVDPALYRDPAAVAEALARDGIGRTRAQLLAQGQAAEVERVEREARAEIDAAVAAATAAPLPDSSAAYTDIQNTGAGVWA
ncbi:MAG TPA: thiamine pyrophosphate-dependent enzyme, partial [Ottowia sp.]|nr:thiamine pyrophosphate-dependent enzyme [Ottowia sp.]